MRLQEEIYVESRTACFDDIRSIVLRPKKITDVSGNPNRPYFFTPDPNFFTVDIVKQ